MRTRPNRFDGHTHRHRYLNTDCGFIYYCCDICGSVVREQKPKARTMNIQEMLDAYIECALWSSTNMDTDEPLDYDYGPEDIHPETLAQMRKDVEDFAKANEKDILTWDFSDPSPESTAGHDFWLTRNHHGAGFWDGDWEDAAGKRLTDAAHAYGGVDLYVGDDGMIHA